MGGITYDDAFTLAPLGKPGSKKRAASLLESLQYRYCIQVTRRTQNQNGFGRIFFFGLLFFFFLLRASLHPRNTHVYPGFKRVTALSPLAFPRVLLCMLGR